MQRQFRLRRRDVAAIGENDLVASEHHPSDTHASSRDHLGGKHRGVEVRGSTDPHSFRRTKAPLIYKAIGNIWFTPTAFDRSCSMLGTGSADSRPPRSTGNPDTFRMAGFGSMAKRAMRPGMGLGAERQLVADAS